MTTYRTFPSPFTRMGEPLAKEAEGSEGRYTTRKGRSLTTSLNDHEAFKALAGKSSDFAKSLYGDADPNSSSSKGLTYEMWLWAHILANEPEKKKGPFLAFEDAPLTKLVEHFDRASGVLKFPKVSLENEDGLKLRLSRAGSRAKVPGSINLTDGKPYGENEWYGRVLKTGVVETSRAFNEGIKALLAAFNDDPAKVAKTSGLLTGNCCFCRKPLTTGESLTAGYGPICADKYALPWGEVDPGVRNLDRYIADEPTEALVFEALPGVEVGRKEADELSGEDLANLAEAENAEDEIAWGKEMEFEDHHERRENARIGYYDRNGN